MPSLEILNAAGMPLAEQDLGQLFGGTPSDPLAIQLWYRRGDASGDPLYDLLFFGLTEDPLQAGTYRRTGLVPQDQQWLEVRATGQIATSHPEQVEITSDWQPIGAYRALALPSLYPDCARLLEVRLRPPSSGGSSWRFRLRVEADGHSLPLPGPAVDLGILSGLGDGATTGLVRGGEVVADGSDTLQVRARHSVFHGRADGTVLEAITLDLVDGAAEALEAGESYWAGLTASPGAVVVSKGQRAAEPAKPQLPAGQSLLAWVQVEYQADGVAIIDPEDVDDGRRFLRHVIEAGPGLNLSVHPGTALGATTRRQWSRLEVVPLAASATSWLWQLEDGRYATTAADVAPSATALGPWAKATTDTANVTELEDLRTYAGATRVLQLGAALPATAGEVARLHLVEALTVDRVIAVISDNGGGTSGQTLLDLELDGATLYPSSAVDDQRPAFAFDAAELRHNAGIPELLQLKAGTDLVLRTLEHPDAAPARVDVYLHCYL